MVGETFYGIAGVDLRLDSLQELADDVKNLYDGAARIVLFSNNGTISGITREPGLLGKYMEEVHKNVQEILQSVKNGEKRIEVAEGRLQVFMPLLVGKSGTPWSVNIMIPEDKITAAADKKVSPCKSKHVEDDRNRCCFGRGCNHSSLVGCKGYCKAY